MPKLNYYRKKRGPSDPGMCGRGKVPQKKLLDSCARHRMHMDFCISMGIPAEHILSFIFGKGKFLPAAVTKNTFERKGIGSHCHELSAETFFPPFRKTATGITHNANSGATERVRNLLGFTGFLVVQTFYSQV